MSDTIRELTDAEIDAVSGGFADEIDPGMGIWSSWWWPWTDINSGGTPPPGVGG